MNISECRNNYLTRALENDFTLIENRIDGHAFKKNDLNVIVSINRELDEKLWLHVSFSYPDRLPPYEKLIQIKNIFIGPDKKAIQVFPQEKEHVNLMEFCLHLWHCIDGDSLPDFAWGLGII